MLKKPTPKPPAQPRKPLPEELARDAVSPTKKRLRVARSG
jgi:hypothetical protein